MKEKSIKAQLALKPENGKIVITVTITTRHLR